MSFLHFFLTREERYVFLARQKLHVFHGRKEPRAEPEETTEVVGDTDEWFRLLDLGLFASQYRVLEYKAQQMLESPVPVPVERARVN